jgi:hypothetical protein
MVVQVVARPHDRDVAHRGPVRVKGARMSPRCGDNVILKHVLRAPPVLCGSSSTETLWFAYSPLSQTAEGFLRGAKAAVGGRGES